MCIEFFVAQDLEALCQLVDLLPRDLLAAAARAVLALDRELAVMLARLRAPARPKIAQGWFFSKIPLSERGLSAERRKCTNWKGFSSKD